MQEGTQLVIDHMWNTAVKLRADGQEVAPVAFVLANKQLGILPLIAVPYEGWRDALCMLALPGPDLVGTLTEAWAVRIEGEEEAAAYGAARDLGVRNEDRDDRIEILQLTAETPDGESFHFWAEIKDGIVGERSAPDHTLKGRLTGIFPTLESSGS